MSSVLQGHRWPKRLTRGATWELAQQVVRGFAGVRCKRGHIHECLHVTLSGGRVGDHHSADGMTDQHHRSLDAIDQTRQITRVALYAAKGVGCRDYAVAVGELADDAFPARRFVEGSMDEDDRRLFIGLSL